MNTFSKYKLQHQLGMVLTYAGLIVALIFFLFTTSLKGNEDYFTFPPVWIPTQPSLVHYYRLFTHGNGWLYFKNSLAISSLSMLAALLFSVPTAYSIARFRFGGSLFSNFLLLLRTMPATTGGSLPGVSRGRRSAMRIRVLLVAERKITPRVAFLV